MQGEEYAAANSKLFKAGYDEALSENTCQVGLCDLISVSLTHYIIHLFDFQVLYQIFVRFIKWYFP